MKKISLLLLLALTLSLFASCSSEGGTDIDAPDGYVGVTNDAVHFTFCYPQNWVCDQNSGDMGLIIVSPSSAEADNKSSVSFHESSALGGDEEFSNENYLNDYWKIQEDELVLNYGDDYTWKENEKITLGEENALKVTYTLKMGETEYFVYQVFAYKYIDSSHRMFTVTYTGTESDISGNGNVFKEMLSTFDFKDE